MTTAGFDRPGASTGAIVAATDFSDDAGYAVRRAALLASQHSLALELLHVVDRAALDAVREWVRGPADLADRLVEDARSALARAATGLGTPASARVAVGDVRDEILANCERAALLVVGAHGLSPLRDAMLGTTAERLAGRCGAPILVVRKPAPQPYRKVVVAVDLLPGSENVVEAASRFAPGSRMAAVHAYEVPFEGALQRAGVSAADIDQHRAEAHRAAVGAIERMSAAAAGDAFALLPAVARGDAARLILDERVSLGADLVVIGKRRRSAVETLLLGSVTRHVIADADCDVLVVRP
jgi:nucleotide-binding universal stress UspA family protein